MVGPWRDPDGGGNPTRRPGSGSRRERGRLWNSSESGAPGFDIVQWYAIWMPAKPQKDVFEKIQGELVRIIHSPEYKQRQLEVATDIVGSSAEHLAAFQKAQIEKYRKIATAAGIKPE